MKQKIKLLICISLILGVLGTTFMAFSHQFRIVKVVSDSMVPTFNKDDLIMVGSVSTKALKIGEIAILPSVTDPGIFYAHRIIGLKRDKSGSIVVQTKGDANLIPDDERLLISSRSTPIYLGVLPISQAPGLLRNSIFLLVVISLLFITTVISNLKSSFKKRKNIGSGYV